MTKVNNACVIIQSKLEEGCSMSSPAILAGKVHVHDVLRRTDIHIKWYACKAVIRQK